jgi:hypothetical protein
MTGTLIALFSKKCVPGLIRLEIQAQAISLSCFHAYFKNGIGSTRYHTIADLEKARFRSTGMNGSVLWQRNSR